ncbi:MAG TPA: hypothetical protein VKB81_09965 [Nitrospira sp.]|nr:hypothetical protein [Nitrospira sp.]
MRMNMLQWMSRKHSVHIAVTVGLLLALTVSPAQAAQRSAAENSGLQAVSWLATIPYGAAKVALALTGGIVGGLTWAVTGGNTTTAKAIWTPTMTGDYIVEPQNLTGEKHLHFIGGSSDKSKA